MDDGQRQSIGAVVRTLREAMGMTRPELSAATSSEPSERVSVEMIAKVEQGRKAPSAKTLRKLAHGLGVEPLELSSSAAKWEAAVVAGAQVAALRAALTAGSLGVRAIAPLGIAAGIGLGPALPLAAAAAGTLVAREGFERGQWARRLEARLAELLERGSAEDIQRALATLDQALPEGPSGT